MAPALWLVVALDQGAEKGNRTIPQPSKEGESPSNLVLLVLANIFIVECR